MSAGNPLLWGKRGGSYSAADAQSEMAGVYTDHVPTILGAVLLLSAGTLIFLQKAGFRFAVEASAGRG